MLAQARVRDIAFCLEQTSLQELSFAGQFDAVLTIDAMDHIPPEDWPGVLANLHHAARPGGLLYLTIHELPRHHIEQAFQSLSARGLPAVLGEIAEPDAPGYHYYPDRDQVAGWFRRQGLAIADEGFRRENGWGNRHFLLRTSQALPAHDTRTHEHAGPGLVTTEGHRPNQAPAAGRTGDCPSGYPAHNGKFGTIAVRCKLD